MVDSPVSKASLYGHESRLVTGANPIRRFHKMEEKSRHEIITRAKISWTEQKTNMTQRAWIDRELREIGMKALTNEEVSNYGLVVTPQLFL